MNDIVKRKEAIQHRLKSSPWILCESFGQPEERKYGFVEEASKLF